MKRHLGVRGLMIAVAVIGVGFAYVSSEWRRGAFAFQRRHADLAAFCGSLAGWARDNLDSLEVHDEPGHSCRFCSGAFKAGHESWRREQEEKYRLWSREAWWHALIAGPAAHGPDVDLGLGPPPPLLRRPKPPPDPGKRVTDQYIRR